MGPTQLALPGAERDPHQNSRQARMISPPPAQSKPQMRGGQKMSKSAPVA